jgi:hypothetical protein
MMVSFRHTVGLILISVFFSVNSELGMKHFYRVENITMKKLAILLEKHEVPGVQYCSVFAHPVLCTLLKLNCFMQSSSLFAELCRFHGDNDRGVRLEY